MKKIILIAGLMLVTTLSFTDIIVIPDDYAMIQSGIDMANPGDTVKVKYDTYYEAIDIDEEILLIKYGAQKPVITYLQGPTVTMTAEATISGFDIETSAQYGNGIRVYGNNTATIDNCEISGTHRGICSEQIQLEVSDCSIHGNYQGVYITTNVEESEYPAVIQNCDIYDNDSGISFNSYGYPSLLVQGCDLYDNDINGFVADGGLTTIKNCSIYGNIDNNNGYGINCTAGYCFIEHCTVYGNYYGVRFNTGDTNTITNSIIWGNTNASIVDSPSVTYSCIEDGYPGTGNINDDPEFEDAANDDFHLRWDTDALSPCIDTGDQATEWDNDGTPPDMGRLKVVKHWYDNWALPDINTDRGWKWMCFPVIDTVTNSHTYVGDMAEYMLADILDTYSLDHVEWIEIETTNNTLQRIYYDDPYWQNIDHIFKSIQGYKFQMVAQDTVYLPISGFLEDSTKTIQLNDEHDNWMGYFIDYSQSVEDAFGTSLENMYYIQTQRWTVTREEPEPESPWIGLSSANRTLNYGDLVIVRCFDDELFAWCDTELEQERDVREETQYFSYEEQADYIPIYVQLDPSDLPDEIAVLVDGECKGAEKVTNDLTDIRAYMLDNSGGNVTFELYYDNKAPVKKISDYFVYNSKDMELEQRSIKVDPSINYYLVTLKEGDTVHFSHEYLLKHYPNPVTSSTEIKFSLPKDEKVSLSIYNIKGQLVKTLIDADIETGLHKVFWDGSNDDGKQVANGIYFYILTADNHILTRKMLYMR